MRVGTSLSAMAATLLIAGPALAQEGDPAADSPPEPVVTLEFVVGAVSDYRYRGVSLSDERPALQASATLTHRSGFYGDVSVSTIDEYGFGPDGDGAVVEVSLLAGWAGSLGAVDLDVGLAGYVYPGGTGVNSIEIPVTLSRTMDAFTVSVGVQYAPAQEALGDEDNAYGWAGLDWAREDSDWAFTAWVGRENGAWAPGGKTDWGVGVRRVLVGSVTAGLTYTDTDVDWAGEALVADIRASF